MKKILYILIGIASVFSACETDADIEIPSQDPKLVLSTFLEPGAELQLLTLYMSDPIFDGSNIDNTTMITNGTITITDGTITKKFRYDFNYNAYVLVDDSMTIEFNKQYKITASYDGKTASATFNTVSNIAPIFTEVKFDSLLEEDPFGGFYITYFGYAKWLDPTAEKNYYCVELYGLQKTGNGDTSRVSLSDFYSNLYLTDDGKNGGQMTATIEAYSYSGEFSGNDYVGFELLLTKTDEHYYKYFKSLQNYGGDDPFSEPSLIYTNVTNGLGLVGSYKPFSFKKGL